jgi:hypothetical protein
VIVEFVAVNIALVAGFIDPQDDGLGKAVEAPKELRRRDVTKIPRPDCMSHRFKERVFAGAPHLAAYSTSRPQ